MPITCVAEAIEYLIKAEKGGAAIAPEAYNFVLRTYFRQAYIDPMLAEQQQREFAAGDDELAETKRDKASAAAATEQASFES